MVDSDSKAPETTPDAIARTARIIAGALITGVLVFLVITLVTRRTGGKGLFAAEPWDVMPPKGLLSLIALATAVMMIVMSFVVPKVQAAAIRRAKPGEKEKAPAATGARPDLEFQSAYMVAMIIGMAMLEGAAFFNGIAFMIEGHVPNLIAAGVLIVLMAARFPTSGRIEAFVQDQSALMLEERQSA